MRTQILWLDAQISPAIAAWINANFSGIQTSSVRQLGLRDAEDRIIFEAARAENVIVMTKDSDFVKMLEQQGPPPKIIWITCGNTSNKRLKEILQTTLIKALALLQAGEKLVEINDQ